MLPSGSKIGLAMLCQHPWTSGLEWPKDEDASRFAYGNSVHDWAEAWPDADAHAIAKARSLNATDVRRLSETAHHVGAKLAALVADGWLVWREVAIAYHVLRGTARLIRRESHRDYSDIRAGELAATLDVVAVKPGRVLLGDWKSGRWQSNDEVSWQLRFGGLAIARSIGASEVDVALWYVAEGGIRYDAAQLDAFDLDEAAHALRELWPKLTSGPTSPVAGDHCTSMWCPLVGRCAATRAALSEVRSSAAVRILTAEDAARVWEMLPHAEAAVKAARKQIEAMAGRQPIPLRNGRQLVVQQVETERVSLDERTAAIVHDAGVPLDYTTSKAAIERALPKVAAAQLLTDLRAAGAIRSGGYTKLAERKGDSTNKMKETG